MGCASSSDNTTPAVSSRPSSTGRTTPARSVSPGSRYAQSPHDAVMAQFSAAAAAAASARISAQPPAAAAALDAATKAAAAAPPTFRARARLSESGNMPTPGESGHNGRAPRMAPYVGADGTPVDGNEINIIVASSNVLPTPRRMMQIAGSQNSKHETFCTATPSDTPNVSGERAPALDFLPMGRLRAGGPAKGRPVDTLEQLRRHEPGAGATVLFSDADGPSSGPKSQA